MHDTSEARVVIRGVVTMFRPCRLAAAADDAPGSAIARSRRLHCVLAVVASPPRWQQAFSVAEHAAVFGVMKRPTLMDQGFGVPRLDGQQGPRHRGCLEFGGPVLGARCTRCHQPCDRSCKRQLTERLPWRRQTAHEHGITLKNEAGMLAERRVILKPRELGAWSDIEMSVCAYIH